MAQGHRIHRLGERRGGGSQILVVPDRDVDETPSRRAFGKVLELALRGELTEPYGESVQPIVHALAMRPPLRLRLVAKSCEGRAEDRVIHVVGCVLEEMLHRIQLPALEIVRLQM